MARKRTVVVGDSLGVGTVPYLQRALGGPVRADVRVGRSSSDGVNALSRLLRGGADQIVLDLGTNDASPQQLRESVQRARKLAGGRPIFIPTVNGPGAAQKNATLRELAGGNVRLVNWARQSGGLVGGDGIHATGHGYQQRAGILARSIERQGSRMATGKSLWDMLQGDSPLAHAAAQAHPQGTGSLADSDGPHNAVFLGQGARAGGLGGSQTPFKRYSVTNRAGKLLEAHDYGGGDIKYFARKNPAILQAAAQQAAARQMHQPTPAMPAGLAPEDLERIKLLLGNPTLSR